MQPWKYKPKVGTNLYGGLTQLRRLTTQQARVMFTLQLHRMHQKWDGAQQQIICQQVASGQRKRPGNTLIT